MGTGYQRKWTRDISLAVEIPYHPKLNGETHFQEEQMDAYELTGFRHSEKEDVLAKPPGGIHLVQAKTTYPMRRLDEA